MDFLFQTRALNVVKSKRAGQSGPVRRPEINPSADVFSQDLGKGIGVWGSKLHGVTLNHKPSDQICGPFVVCWFSWLRENTTPHRWGRQVCGTETERGA